MTAQLRTVLSVALALVVSLVATSCGGSEDTVLAGPSVAPAAASNRAVTVDRIDDADAEAVDHDAEQAEGLQLPDGFFEQVELPDAGSADQEQAGGNDATPDDGDTLSVASLKAVAAKTESAESYRFAINLEWSMSDPAFSFELVTDEPMMTGQYAGGASSLNLDLGPMMEALVGGIDGGDEITSMLGADLTMQMVDDGEGKFYLRAPMFAALGQDPTVPADLAALGTGWGVIDVTELDELSAADLAGLAGAQGGASPDAMLDLLRSAGTVEEVGQAEVGGVMTDHLRVGVHMGELMEAQGMDVAELGVLVGGDLSAWLDVTIPYDVYVDADERVRRIAVTIDTDTVAALVGEAMPASSSFSMTTTMDFYDFDADITIAIPSADDVVVDLTDSVGALFG